MTTKQIEGMRHIVEMFGTAAELSRRIGIHRAAVMRWQSGERPLLDAHKVKIAQAGHAMGLPMDRLVWALDVAKCDCCGTISDRTIRELMTQDVDA